MPQSDNLRGLLLTKLKQHVVKPLLFLHPIASNAYAEYSVRPAEFCMSDKTWVPCNDVIDYPNASLQLVTKERIYPARCKVIWRHNYSTGYHIVEEYFHTFIESNKSKPLYCIAEFETLYCNTVFLGLYLNRISFLFTKTGCKRTRLQNPNKTSLDVEKQRADLKLAYSRDRPTEAPCLADTSRMSVDQLKLAFPRLLPSTTHIVFVLNFISDQITHREGWVD